MAVIVETRHLGIHCGRTWTILLLIISFLYLLICLGTTLVTRLYLKGFYSAAHVAAISAVASLFVIYHHFGRLRKTLGVTKKCYSVYQIGLNAYFLLCCLATAIGYSILLSYAINTNYDYLGAMWFGWMSTVLLSYILGVVISSCCTHRSDSYDLQHDMNTLTRIHFNETTMSNNGFDEDESPRSTFRKRSRTKYADDPNFNVDDPDNPTYLPPPELMQKPEAKSSKYCKMCCRSFFWILYVILQLVLIILFFMTAYHPHCVLVDIVKFREDSSLYTVEINNQRPQALFLHCYGSGSETIVFESDIRTTALMYFDGLPKYMADHHGFRVCVYDRRGKGWSEGLENDFIDSHNDGPQWSKSNVQFLKELVKVAKIKTPFYYAGFGYGGHHATYMALDNSRLVKGLIYINPEMFGKNGIQPSQTNKNYSRFEDLKDDSFVAKIYTNFHATGFVRLAEQLGITSVEEHFENYAEFSILSADHKKSLFASLRSNSYFPAQVRENEKYLLSDFARDNINRDIYKKKIGKPVIVVEGSSSGIEPVLKWFPKKQFLQFSTGNVLTVTDATYKSMVLSDSRYMKIVAEFIKDKLLLI